MIWEDYLGYRGFAEYLCGSCLDLTADVRAIVKITKSQTSYLFRLYET